MSRHPVTEAELHAWVDSQLPDGRRREIEAWLEEQPEEAARLQSYKRQKAQLQAIFNPVLHEPLPSALLRRTALPWRAPAWRAAAGFALLAIGTGAGWLLHGGMENGSWLPGQAGTDGLARQAAIAHAVYSPEVRHPVEVGADQEAHLVAWLSKRLGAPVRPPRLTQLGYELIGGRLLPGESGPVALFMYQGPNGQRLSLYVSSGQKTQDETGFRYAREGQLNVFYWVDRHFGYALSAALDKNELTRIASLVYQQLGQS